MRRQAANKYMRGLVDRFFKILPMWEDREPSVTVYIESLLLELNGFNALSRILHDDKDYVSLLAILRFLADNPNLSDAVVKREVFRAISICNRLRARYLYDKNAVGDEEVSL